jgi:hypothetical protein
MLPLRSGEENPFTKFIQEGKAAKTLKRKKLIQSFKLSLKDSETNNFCEWIEVEEKAEREIFDFR